MNSNWSGLIHGDNLVSRALEKIVIDNFGASENARKAGQWYSVFASGPGIFGLGSRVYSDDAILAKFDPEKTDIWNVANPDHVNGGSTTRLPLQLPGGVRHRLPVACARPRPDRIPRGRKSECHRNKIPVIETFRGKATAAMESRGLANWALSMGRQRLGLLTLQNQPQFLQNLPMPRLQTATNTLDVPALDLIRDRERGSPLQRVPPAIRLEAVDPLRRLHRSAPSERFAGSG